MQNNLRSYDTAADGTIFTTDIQQFVDDAGNEIARGLSHRTPYTPDTALNTITDPTLLTMATALWTDAVVAAYTTQQAANLKGT